MNKRKVILICCYLCQGFRRCLSVVC